MSAKAMEIIKQEVENNPVVLYMKGTPDFPQCGFSARSAEALKACGVPFKAVNVFDDEEIPPRCEDLLQLADHSTAVRQR